MFANIKECSNLLIENLNSQILKFNMVQKQSFLCTIVTVSFNSPTDMLRVKFTCNRYTITSLI